MVRKFPLVLILVIVMNISAKTQEASTKASLEEQKQMMLKLQDEEDRALLRVDLDALSRLWADDILFPNGNGTVLTKAQRLEEARTKVHNFDVFRHDDIDVRIYNGNTGVVIVYSATSKKYEGKVSGGPRRASIVWFKQPNGQWQMVEHEVTDMSGR